MKKFLIISVVLLTGLSVYAASKTQEDYKQELLDKGYLFGCAPANWSLIEPIRGGFNYAVQKNRIDIMELEVKAGLDPLSCSNMNGFNAITTKSYEALDTLLKYGYNPNDIILGNTYLTYAIYKKDAEAIEILIKHKADVNFAPSDSGYPLNIAIKKKQPKIVKMLLAAGAKPNAKTFKLIEKTKNQEIKDLFKQ